MNFGSGWFPTLRKRAGSSGYFTVAWALADRFRAHGPWTPAQLRAMRTDEIADTLGQPRDHELMALYAQALRALGGFLGERDALRVARAARGSAQALAAQLARSMALFADRGFYKRAQIVPANLALAGVARFKDLDRLTIFADNLVPHVLRCDGVLRYDDGSPRTSTPGGCCRPGARSARSAPAPCTPASSSPGAPAPASTSSTTGCGAAARRRGTRRSRDTGEPTIYYLRWSAASGARALSGSQRVHVGEGLPLGPRQLGDLPLELGDPRRQARDRVSDRVGQVDPVGVGALGTLAVDATGWPGLPTTVVFGGTSLITTELAPIFAPWPTVIAPSSFAPAPTVTLSSSVGWRLPV